MKPDTAVGVAFAFFDFTGGIVSLRRRRVLWVEVGGGEWDDFEKFWQGWHGRLSWTGRGVAHASLGMEQGASIQLHMHFLNTFGLVLIL